MTKLQSHGIARLRYTACVAIAAHFGFAFPVQSQPYLPLHEGPSYNGTSGYTNPRFRDAVFGVASPGVLLNNSGAATWDAIESPANERRALRWNPLAGPALELEASGDAIPFAMNAAGTVVGNIGADGARWDSAGTSATVLPGVGIGGERVAFDINDSDVSVGYARKIIDEGDRGERAVRWDAEGNVLEMGSISFGPLGIAFARAFAVNNSGTAVGAGAAFVSNLIKGDRAVRWDAAGAATQLGHLGTDTTGTTSALAWAINASGQAVGRATKYDAMGNLQGQRATLWNAATTSALELELLGSDGQNLSVHSQAYDINDAGTIVGHAVKYVGGIGQGARAVIWNVAGQATELGALGTGLFAQAYDINESGIAVGVADAFVSPTFAARKAVYWGSDGVAIDLNTLIAPSDEWELTTAWAISDTGWILGEGVYDPPGAQVPYQRVFMLQVPVEVDLPGDYNDDNRVDAADYVVWRKNLGANVALPNDSTPGSVIPYDYAVWRANFGAALTVGEEASHLQTVPEPTTCALLVLSLVAFPPQLRWRVVRRPG